MGHPKWVLVRVCGYGWGWGGVTTRASRQLRCSPPPAPRPTPPLPSPALPVWVGRAPPTAAALPKRCRANRGIRVVSLFGTAFLFRYVSWLGHGSSCLASCPLPLCNGLLDFPLVPGSPTGFFLLICLCFVPLFVFYLIPLFCGFQKRAVFWCKTPPKNKIWVLFLDPLLETPKGVLFWGGLSFGIFFLTDLTRK